MKCKYIVTYKVSSNIIVQNESDDKIELPSVNDRIEISTETKLQEFRVINLENRLTLNTSGSITKKETVIRLNPINSNVNWYAK